MPINEPITMHVVPFSHPCMTARAGLQHKGLDFEEVMLLPGNQEGKLEGIYGEGKTTVPGIVVGDETVHSSVAILRYLDEKVPEKPLYPETIAGRVRDAEEWGDRELQDIARRLVFGVLHFSPGSMGTFAGAGELDAAGTDFAMKNLHLTWRYLGLNAVGLTEDLRNLPAVIEKIQGLADEGVIGSDEPTAADFQVGASCRVLTTIRDLDPVLDGSAAQRIAFRHFPDYPGEIPAGSFPATWISF
ncbi:MAG: glutathione S-transferase family protein [Actinomycetota bacterium]|nr:glutathione S-transferase family protein [Actinomycetota bacterium]